MGDDALDDQLDNLLDNLLDDSVDSPADPSGISRSISTSVSGQIWRPKSIDQRLVYRYMNDYSISDILARILVARGVTEVENFLYPKIRDLLPDPFHLLDMEKACDRVIEAIKNGEKMVVFGDYDVDGATSSALLIRLFRHFQIADAGFSAEVYIPNRMLEGYGLNSAALQKFKEEGASLVITVDCGITSFEPVDYANSIGLDVIVLDHHLSDIILPKAHAVVNPNRFDETSNYKHLAAVGVSFLFAVGLVQKLRAQGFFANKKEPDLISLLDLVALGTTCDMMSLTGVNRAFVVQGLKVMAQSQNLGIKTLSEFGKVDSKLSSYHLGFVIGPRINAGGRVGKSYLGSHLLATHDQDLAFRYASELEQYNDERKLIEQMVIEEAMEQASEWMDYPFIFVSSNNWHQGVIGIVAGKLKDKFNKPTIAISIEDGIGKASCRSVKGVDLGQKITEAKRRELLLGGGGHAMAAGFTAAIEKFPELIAFLKDAIGSDIDAIQDASTYYYDAELSPAGVTVEFARELETLEPYGNGNSEPIIKVDGLYVLRASIANNKHINCLLAPDRDSYGNKAIRGIAFNAIGTSIGDILLSEKAHKISVLCNVKVNTWQGNSTAQLSIRDIITNSN